MIELVLLALVVVLAALVVVAFLIRRRLLLTGLGAVTMWLRPPGSPRWSVGVAWYGGDTLLWYRALSLSVRPGVDPGVVRVVMRSPPVAGPAAG